MQFKSSQFRFFFLLFHFCETPFSKWRWIFGRSLAKLKWNWLKFIDLPCFRNFLFTMFIDTMESKFKCCYLSIWNHWFIDNHHLNIVWIYQNCFQEHVSTPKNLFNNNRLNPTDQVGTSEPDLNYAFYENTKMNVRPISIFDFQWIFQI